MHTKPQISYPAPVSISIICIIYFELTDIQFFVNEASWKAVAVKDVSMHPSQSILCELSDRLEDINPVPTPVPYRYRTLYITNATGKNMD